MGEKLIMPVKVSADIEKSLKDLIEQCGFHYRDLIERGFAASIPEGMDVHAYILSLADREINQKQRIRDQKKDDYDKSEEDYQIAVKQKRIMLEQKISFNDVKDENTKWLMDNKEMILSKYTVKQSIWENDFSIIQSLKREYDVDITWNFLYKTYDHLRGD